MRNPLLLLYTFKSKLNGARKNWEGRSKTGGLPKMPGGLPDFDAFAEYFSGVDY
ncbi:hypothetical protein [Pseudooceanicola algae]|uniref:hypothetical protein n=1 Tax=Pseudooceanicola algae TaxID=1537215 RepID=UPI0018AD2229|nr:hypothetical protein [Pseudooceanicola algae]